MAVKRRRILLRRKPKPRNNGFHVKGRREGRRWTWRVFDCRRGTGVQIQPTHTTQRAAIEVARARAVINRCELVIHGRDGAIHRKDSFGRDPRGVKG